MEESNLYINEEYEERSEKLEDTENFENVHHVVGVKENETRLKDLYFHIDEYMTKALRNLN